MYCRNQYILGNQTPSLIHETSLKNHHLVNSFISLITPWKFNIDPENKPSEKEIHLPTMIFQGRTWKTSGVFHQSWLNMDCITSSFSFLCLRSKTPRLSHASSWRPHCGSPIVPRLSTPSQKASCDTRCHGGRGILSMVVSGSLNRWDRYHIITQLARTISGIVTANWAIIWYRSHLLREPETSIDFTFPETNGAKFCSWKIVEAWGKWSFFGRLGLFFRGELLVLGILPCEKHIETAEKIHVSYCKMMGNYSLPYILRSREGREGSHRKEKIPNKFPSEIFQGPCSKTLGFQVLQVQKAATATLPDANMALEHGIFGRLLSFWEGLFSGAMLVQGGYPFFWEWGPPVVSWKRRPWLDS